MATSEVNARLEYEQRSNWKITTNSICSINETLKGEKKSVSLSESFTYAIFYFFAEFWPGKGKRTKYL